eukprot:jgi/Botrbrau1/5614/Bobra.55_1s0003.1
MPWLPWYLLRQLRLHLSTLPTVSVLEFSRLEQCLSVPLARAAKACITHVSLKFLASGQASKPTAARACDGSLLGWVPAHSWPERWFRTATRTAPVPDWAQVNGARRGPGQRTSPRVRDGAASSLIQAKTDCKLTAK